MRPSSMTDAAREVEVTKILALIGDGAKTCREIAEACRLDRKQAYGIVMHMYQTLGVIGPAEKDLTMRGKAVWWERRREPEPKGWNGGARQIITSDWPRGEHRRDAWDVALFGDRRVASMPAERDPRQMDLLEGID